MKSLKERYREGQRYIIPTSDWGFKRLFGTEMNKNLLIGFLNRVIDDRTIETVEYLNTEPILPLSKSLKMSFDVYCKCTDGSRIIVEMQNYVRSEFVSRAQLYTSTALIERYLSEKRKEAQVQKTYFIAITGENVFPRVKHAPVRLSMCDIDSKETLVLNDKDLQIFIELPKFAETVQALGDNANFLDKFAVVMKTLEQYKEPPMELKDELLEGLFSAADTKCYDAADKENYKAQLMNQFEYEATLRDYKEEGRAEGLAEGREEGRAEGLVEGRDEARAEIARAMKAKGLSDDIIKDVTGVSPDAL
jgi:predicted transposase/invertase (TIGR01784 family)